jgi:DNA-binding transcriptional LysR family regulator
LAAIIKIQIRPLLIRNIYQLKYDLKHLAAFVAVGDELNFHRAAEKLGIAQPAVSRMIGELEQRLGVKLMERTTRRVSLTESGSYLREEARAILRRVELSERTAKSFASGTKAILRLTYMNLAGHALVPDIVSEFRREHPDIRCEMTYLTSPLQRDGILKSEIDVGFIVGPFVSSEIDSKPVARHPLVALLPADHPLGKKKVLTVQDLADEPLVLGTMEEWPTLRQIIVNVFQGEGKLPSIAQEASSLTGILGLVTAGVGPTIFCGVPRFCTEPTILARRIMTQQHAYVDTHMIWKKNRITIPLKKFIKTADEISKAYLTE